MSSIAYTTDEKMLEYHRLCRSHTILFWRLSSRKITDFRKGDLLFFFSKPNHGRKKGLVGYAHYDSTKRLSLNQMWKQYGQATGYDTKERLTEAISHASKGNIPKQMRCLYLTDVVFFTSPVYPENIGIDIPNKLESYIYLDRDDPKVTVRILQAGERRGIDLWSADPDISPDVIFHNDVTRHELALISHETGKESGSEKERSAAHKLAKEQIQNKGWEMVRGSRTDCLHMDSNKITLAIPYTYQLKDHDVRMREYIGKVTMYRVLSQRYKLDRKLVFKVLSDQESEDIEKMIKEINHA